MSADFPWPSPFYRRSRCVGRLPAFPASGFHLVDSCVWDRFSCVRTGSCKSTWMWSSYQTTIPNPTPPNTTRRTDPNTEPTGSRGWAPRGEFLLSWGEGVGSRRCAGPHLCGTRAGAMERETGTPRGATGEKDQDGRRGKPWRTRVDGEDKVILHARPSAVPQTKPSVSCNHSVPPPHSTRLVKLRCFSWKSLHLHVGRGALLEPSLHVMSLVEGIGRYGANMEVGTRPPKEDLFILGFGCGLHPNNERADRPLKEAHTGLWRRRRRNKQWTGQVIPQLHFREERASTALANQEK